MPYYIALIEKDATSDYSVLFPDLPGVVTVEGMIADGEAVPTPSSLDEILADPANRDGVAFFVVPMTKAMEAA
jgi:predicted RNase H-like HicB family nuclease